jgi:hypothetical protein
MEELDDLRGQFAALEHLVMAMLAAHPNKTEVQAIFLRQTEMNAARDLYSTSPEAFLNGFSRRQKMLADLIAAYIASQG